jgi:hypothetical protein
MFEGMGYNKNAEYSDRASYPAVIILHQAPQHTTVTYKISMQNTSEKTKPFYKIIRSQDYWINGICEQGKQ